MGVNDVSQSDGGCDDQDVPAVEDPDASMFDDGSDGWTTEEDQDDDGAWGDTNLVYGDFTVMQSAGDPEPRTQTTTTEDKPDTTEEEEALTRIETYIEGTLTGPPRFRKTLSKRMAKRIFENLDRKAVTKEMTLARADEIITILKEAFKKDKTVKKIDAECDPMSGR